MINNKELSGILILLLMTSHLSATSQFRDLLEYGGDVWIIGSFPLSSVDKDLYDSFEQNLFNPETGGAIWSTGCWRGYIAIWTVEDGYLFLDHFKGLDDTPDSLKCHKLALKHFAKYVRNGRIRADWIRDETFAVSAGELIRNNWEYSIALSKRMYMRVRKGKVTFSRQFGENAAETGKPLNSMLAELIPLGIRSGFNIKKITPGRYSVHIAVNYGENQDVLKELLEFKRSKYPLAPAEKKFTLPKISGNDNYKWINPLICTVAPRKKHLIPKEQIALISEQLEWPILRTLLNCPWKFYIVDNLSTYEIDSKGRFRVVEEVDPNACYLNIKDELIFTIP